MVYDKEMQFKPEEYGENVDPSVVYQLEAGRVGQYGTLAGTQSERLSAVETKRNQIARANAARGRAAAKDRESWEQEEGWRRTRAEDGGWNFWDPDGNPITMWEFSDNRGETIETALSGSRNPSDMNMLQDYETALTEAATVGGSYKDVIGSLAQDYPHAFTTQISGEEVPWENQITAFNEATRYATGMLDMNYSEEDTMKYVEGKFGNQIGMDLMDQLKVAIEERRQKSGEITLEEREQIDKTLEGNNAQATNWWSKGKEFYSGSAGELWGGLGKASLGGATTTYDLLNKYFG